MGRCLLEVGLYRRVVGGEVFVRGRFMVRVRVMVRERFWPVKRIALFVVE